MAPVFWATYEHADDRPDGQTGMTDIEITSDEAFEDREYRTRNVPQIELALHIILSDVGYYSELRAFFLGFRSHSQLPGHHFLPVLLWGLSCALRFTVGALYAVK